MSKNSKIRWRKRDEKELKRIVKNFNAKVTYHAKKNPQNADYLPEKVSVKTLKQSIVNRQDYNRLIKKLERFSEKGAEKVISSKRGAKTTVWELDEFKRAERAENIKRAKRKKELEDMEVTIGNKGTGQKRAEMGKIRENAVKESKKNFDNMSMDEWKKAVDLFEKKMRSDYDEKATRQMLAHYIKGLIHEGYSDELLELMNTIPLQKFLDVVDTDELATFDFIYDQHELFYRNEVLIELWKEHSTGENINKIDINNLVKEYEEELLQGLR